MDYGHFSDDGREYVITRVPTPRPWENYLSNASYGLRVDAVGSGYSRLPVAPGNRITLAEPGQVFYVRDRESPSYWSLTWMPVGGDHDRYQCRHGLGYSIFEMARDGIHSSLRVFVPLQDQVEIWTATLRNAGDRPRRLALFSFTEWHLAPVMRPWDNYRNYIESHWVEEERLVVATLAEPAVPGIFYRGFAALSAPVSSYDTEVAAFCGPGGLLAPLAVALGECRNSDMPGDGRACAALATEIDLAPGEEKSIGLVVGFAGDAAARARLVQADLDPEAAEREFAKLRAQWRATEAQVNVTTPEAKIDRMVNLWLKDNALQLTRVIRENVRGYRDMLQDAMAVASFAPEIARDTIVTACAHQCPDGHAPRQIAYAGGPHDLRVYNDSPLWLIFALTRYLKESGDMALLDQEVGFFEGDETAPVFEHATRAVDWLNERRGWHDLIRIDRGDWCDALDEVGVKGKGVSVWLSQAFHLGLLEFVELCRAVGKASLADQYQQAADALRTAIEEHAWDGEWYLAAISDAGRRLGAVGEAAMEIYLNTQSWAVIGRIADAARAASALDAADRKLAFRYGPLLLDPPYYAYDPDVGRLSVLRPGCGENGTVYVHAAVFYFLANLMAGRADRAPEVLTQICPMMEAQDPAITHAAPYSYVNSYVGPCYPAHEGRTLTNWYTSSGSWTFFAITDWMLGVRPQYDGLLIAPCLPSEWERASLTRAWRGAEYDVRITKPTGMTRGEVSLTVDGKAVAGDVVPAYGDGKRHVVEAVVHDAKGVTP
jgi:cellobiose phosphorylase